MKFPKIKILVIFAVPVFILGLVWLSGRNAVEANPLEAEALSEAPVLEKELIDLLETSDMSDPAVRERIAGQVREREEAIREATHAKAKRLGIPIREVEPDGTIIELMGFNGDRPIYNSTQNVNAAISSGASQIREQAPYDLTGAPLGPTVPVMAGESPAPPATLPAAAVRPLNVEGAKIEQVRHYLGGFGDTQMFIRIPGQKAIVHLRIDHTSSVFATAGKVVLFAADAAAESIDNWINNQHSSGLFADVAVPVFTGELPEGSCMVTEHNKIGEAAGPTENAPYHDYQVKLAVKAHTEPGQYTLGAFETEAQVYLKITN